MNISDFGNNSESFQNYQNTLNPQNNNTFGNTSGQSGRLSSSMSSGKRISMERYFGINRANKNRMSVPAQANVFGFLIENRRLRGGPRDEVTGLKAHEIPFQYIEEIPPMPKQAQYEDITVQGRFEALPSYSSGSATNFSISLIFYAEGSKALNHRGSFWMIENIKKLILKLESLVWPEYDRKFDGPNLVLLNIGDIYIDIPIKITSISTTPLPPFDIKTLDPYMWKVNMECRTAYPLYQAISNRDLEIAKTGRGIYAFKRYNRVKAR